MRCGGVGAVGGGEVAGGDWLSAASSVKTKRTSDCSSQSGVWSIVGPLMCEVSMNGAKEKRIARKLKAENGCGVGEKDIDDVR